MQLTEDRTLHHFPIAANIISYPVGVGCAR
jgi:hypothetical protein